MGSASPASWKSFSKSSWALKSQVSQPIYGTPAAPIGASRTVPKGDGTFGILYFIASCIHHTHWQIWQCVACIQIFGNLWFALESLATFGIQLFRGNLWCTIILRYNLQYASVSGVHWYGQNWHLSDIHFLNMALRSHRLQHL